ncbi:MAG: ketoacyl-ACP synthase III [Planctomycetaceae bacterium]|nr:ketoacyl-ACP synthase III [Planctomycetaceae bacterium]
MRHKRTAVILTLLTVLFLSNVLMSIHAEIKSIAVYLPEHYLDNAELERCFSNWTEEKIVRKLGIQRRPIAAAGETSADMAVKAAEKFFEHTKYEPEGIGFVLFCTQSPDYLLPTSACLIHEKLGLPKSCGAMDFNLGCSGYIYGLSLAKGLIENGTVNNVLFITSETYSKYINPLDRATRPLFGDGAAATFITAVKGEEQQTAAEKIGPFVFGTDGGGAELLIVPAGGCRMPKTAETAAERPDGKGSIRSKEQLDMHGPGIFSFAIDRVPPTVEELLQKSGKSKNEIGCYVFHQANKYMLDRLQELCGLEGLNYFNDVMERGNTVSSSIPIGMLDAWNAEMLKPDEWTMLVGFGVGLSWGGTLVKLPPDFTAVI